MSNRQLVRSTILLGSYLAVLLAVLGLCGCGSGGADGSSGATSQRAVALASSISPNTIPPSVPGNLYAIPVSSAQVKLAWSASTGNLGIHGYRIQRNGSLVIWPGNVTTYEDTGLSASTAYSYIIQAFDSSGNFSGQSNVAVATTLVTDTTPPMVSSTSPTNAAINIAVNSTITVNFSKTMLNSTLSTDTFTLTTQAGVPITGTVSVSSNTATFTPSTPLAASTPYTATMTTGAKDSAGNPLAANFTWNFTTGAVPDTTPPTVSATAPANVATGVALNSSISATFSKPMTNATLTTASFTLITTSGSAAISGGVNISGNTATFTPSAALSGSTQYTATITTGAQDAAGNALGANFTWTFTTAAAPDTTPPTVSVTSPVNGATGVALNSSVSATFSKPMTNSTLTTASFTLVTTTGRSAVTGTVSVSGNTATFTPSAALAAGTLYTATITTAAKDAAGNALAAIFSSTFTTAAVLDTTPPTVSATSPVNGATGVALDSPVSATFSEPMTNSTLTTASFTLVTTTGRSAVTGTVSVSGNTATFTPSAPLAASTQYTAIISPDAKDAAGNGLALHFTSSFTTASGTGPPSPVPSVSMTANPTSVTSGGSSTLTWSSTNATFCTASGQWSGARATSGNESSVALTSPSIFSLACTGLGGTASASATVMVAPTGANSYATSFPLSENPISEGGRWINGGTVGLGWTNVSTTPGLAIGQQIGASYTDATALLTGTWGPDQMASATVHTVSQNDACFQEVELRLRSALSANVSRGYEISFKMSQTSGAYLIIVRWNGALGDFTYLFNQTGTQFGIKNGDVVSAKIVGNVITAYINGVPMGQADITSIVGTVYTTGSPGMGFNLENAPAGCSGTNGNYGFTNYNATDAP